MPLVREFEQFWNSAAAPPDVFSFLKEQENADSDLWLEVLRVDQKRRWATDSPLTVEDYLAGLPNLPAGVDWKLQLAIGEFEARRNTTRPLSDHEISSRFPDLSDTLRDRLRKLRSGDQASPGQDDQSLDDSAVDPAEVDQILPTVIKPQGGPSSTVTYITGNAIGVLQKGRYRLDRVLGEGGFGRVYLGFDEELHRQVAIKVPTKARFQKPEDAEVYLAEARVVARLDHPHIVPVYDMGRTQDGSIYVVSRFIEGSTLEDRIKAGRPLERDAAQLLVTVALALQHAHDRRLIHRDIKPANILLEGKSNAPYVADFGLAICEEDYLKQNAIAGTPAYMSPEQIRGEGHRLDGRSDIFSLGVILYELLTGKKPFRGSSTQETLHLVLTQEPRPPRELLDTIPAELERICLKALSKRASDRYATAAEFADDLEQWLKPAAAVAQTKAAVQVVPKGLRSFDANDADFFLDLLPGQRNRDGLPESIAFWKQRIEQTDPEQTFSVGLIYGPSGCGKSSLVKAGLMPHLSDSVIAVYVEATPEDTEPRILRGLRKRLPDLSEDLGLADTLAALRRGQGNKVVIIVDQFEQWLHAHRAESDAELVKALRQCDGGRLQAILMIRDDFYVAASRLMQALDIEVVPGRNFLLVDLFDIDHARKVLIRFGQAFGKLPANAANLSMYEDQFVTSVVSGLAEDGKVVSVRLSLMAEMVKAKPWKPETLEQVGGTAGIGVNFLEETFASVHADPRFRRHSVAARGVLRALLPELDTDIKGSMRSHAELLAASGYQDRPADFNDLLRILDGELRLITPTDPEGDSYSGSSRDSSLATRYYQLTHDYLVPSLREWLTRKQKETRRGRAELKLSERSALWNAKPENRYLPSLPEWLSIRTMTESKNWTPPQRTMMSRAARMHGLRTGLATALLVALVFTGFSINKAVNDRQEKLLAKKQEEQNQAEAKRLVEGLLAANTAQVSTSLASLKDFRTWADPQLQQAFKDSAAGSDAKLHAGLALVADGQTINPPVLEFLRDRLLTVTPAQLAPVRELLEPHKAALIPTYWKLATDVQQPSIRRFLASCALAAFDLGSSHAQPEQSSPHAPSEEPQGDSGRAGWNDCNFTTFVAEQLVTVSPEYIGQFKELLRPVAPQLVPALSDIFKDPVRGELAKSLATSLLADYAAKDPDTLTEVVLAADAVSDKSLFPVLQQHRSAAVKNLESVLDERLEPDWKDAPLDAAWTEPSPAVRAQIESAHGLIAERFAFCQDMPLSGFPDVAETLRTSGYRPTRVRPWKAHHAERDGYIAAIWTRDTKRWVLDPSLKKSDLPAPDASPTKDNLLLTDLAPIPAADETAEPQFIALWSEPGSPEEQRRTRLDLTEAEITAAQTALTQQGFISQCTITLRTDANGQRHYSGIWSNQGAASELRPAYAGFELVEQPQWDVAVARSEPLVLVNPRGSLDRQIAEISGKIATAPTDNQLLLTRGQNYYFLGDDELAVQDFDTVFESGDRSEQLLRFRTFVLARLGRDADAVLCRQLYLDRNTDKNRRLLVQVLSAAWLNNESDALQHLANYVNAHSGSASVLFNAAKCASFASLPSKQNAAGSNALRDRAIELLGDAIRVGFDDIDAIKTSYDLVPLHNEQRFLELLTELEPPAMYASLWRADVEYESKLLTSVPLDRVLDQLKPLLAAGYCPFSVAINMQPLDPVPSPPGKGEKVADKPDERARTTATAVAGLSTEPLCSLVLHRPLIPDAEKETLALQQAAAATALLRLNAPEKVWPLFQDQPDPRLRSYLLHRLAMYGVDPQSLLTQLLAESETSRQRALILGLGEFARARLLSMEQQAAVIADLAKRYADDADPGVHGAAEWTLRQLGADAAVAEVRAAYSTGTAVGDRRWYLTMTGTGTPAFDESRGSSASSGMTFAIIQPEEEFLMGSPVSEAERFGGPTNTYESRHRRRIGRRFAIGMHEITVAQFRAFRSDHQFERVYAREEDAPANRITWYDAAAYCNWLSKEEGLPPEEWCYDPDQAFAEGMMLVSEYLQRTGYRLPSEAEWEYACRAGTTTSRYFGETETLLGEYAWYLQTSGAKWMLPVGTLRPNRAGLFDMQGNVLEWCQDAALLYDTSLTRMNDKEQTGELDNSSDRDLRGGSFVDLASLVRSANRNSYQPVSRNYYGGFRVGRTLPPVPLTALPPAEGGGNLKN